MIKFIYKNAKYSKERESVLINIYSLAKDVLSLPDYIEIEIESLAESVYAESIANTRFKNRIRLNDKLTLTELIQPIVHELIHLEQIHMGRLSTNRQGHFIFDNKIYKNLDPLKLTFEDYKNLPWEQDVRMKEKRILDYVLNFGNN
jgi:hypothetical protein